MSLLFSQKPALTNYLFGSSASKWRRRGSFTLISHSCMRSLCMSTICSHGRDDVDMPIVLIPAPIFLYFSKSINGSCGDEQASRLISPMGYKSIDSAINGADRQTVNVA